MRGKVEKCEDLSDVRGITPAYAGKRPVAVFTCRFIQDHPRLCGEKTEDVFDLPTQTGSPPPMRGKGFLSLTIFTRARITPAYAGKSKFLLYIFPHTRDHPRLCGEKLLVSAEMRTAEGSPPPMRGKVVPRLYNTDLNGITPAYAGKRISWSNPWEQSGDHPRLCGEKNF